MSLLDAATIDGVGVSERFGDAIQHATQLRSTEQAPTITLTLLDPDLDITNSPLISRLSDDDDVIIGKANPRLEMPPVMVIDGNSWVLVAADKGSGRVLTLVFESLEVYLLRVTNTYRKVFRLKVDRVAFAESMCREAGVKFHAPQAGPGTPKFTTSTATPGAASGFDASVKIFVSNGTPANADQIDSLTTALDYAISLGASEDALIGMVMCGSSESSWRRNAVNTDAGIHAGIYQQNDIDYTAPYSVLASTHEFLVGAGTWNRAKGKPETTDPQSGSWLALMKGYTGQTKTLGDLLVIRERPAVPGTPGGVKAAAHYNEFYAESKRTVAAFQSPNRKREHTVLLKDDKYEFTRGQPGQPESTWDCLARLASEIGWRRFMVGDTVWFVADEWLFATPPIATLAESTGVAEEITWSWDRGKPVNTCEVAVDDTWIHSPGVVFKVEGQGPATGKWLLSEWERDLLSPTGTLRLIKPGQTIPEPVGDQSGKGWKRSNPRGFDPGSVPSGSDVGSLVAKWAISYAPTPPPAYHWGAKHSVPFSAILANPHPAPPFDCSSFARWAWGANGKIDIAVPNGDTTYSQIQNARQNPAVLHGEGGALPPGGFQPGDLVYTSSGGHVSIIVGPNDTVSAEQTSTGIQRRTLDWHGSVFFWARWSGVGATP